MFIGGQHDSEPSAGVCPLPGLSIFCALSFAVEVVVHFFRTFRGKPPSRITPIILLGSSSFLSLCVALEVLVVGLKNPSDVQRNESHLYCHVTSPIPNLVVCVLSIIFSLATMMTEVVIVVVMRKAMFQLGCEPSSLSKQFLVRLFAFSACICLVVCISIYSLISPPVGGTLSAWYILLNAVPICGVVTFGTQKDILRFYFQRKRDPNVGQQEQRMVQLSGEDVSRNSMPLDESGNGPSRQTVSSRERVTSLQP
ncbi:hypothetical protein IW261DRAFT_1480942 [Armillaria novae-zelandiae]|uniref:Uncharacterized protein n=1 Tax=Armillaria novae-zelandiae TaxID=153914 RepID=A0AA39P8F1_9AGAR|nr:hypothetical protein IW261DRAFT_1480942 [Armillaria novae-zelandiae]